jgi:hypothetical protein
MIATMGASIILQEKAIHVTNRRALQGSEPALPIVQSVGCPEPAYSESGACAHSCVSSLSFTHQNTALSSSLDVRITLQEYRWQKTIFSSKRCVVGDLQRLKHPVNLATASIGPLPKLLERRPDPPDAHCTILRPMNVLVNFGRQIKCDSNRMSL